MPPSPPASAPLTGVAAPAYGLDGCQAQVIQDLMNISIGWPCGRGDKVHVFDDTCDSNDVSHVMTHVIPFDLADTRKRDWPTVDSAFKHHELTHIYQQVCATGLSNMLGLRLPVPSMLKVPMWESLATGHSDDKYVLDGIKFGFPLHYTGPILNRPKL